MRAALISGCNTDTKFAHLGTVYREFEITLGPGLCLSSSNLHPIPAGVSYPCAFFMGQHAPEQLPARPARPERLLRRRQSFRRPQRPAVFGHHDRPAPISSSLSEILAHPSSRGPGRSPNHRRCCDVMALLRSHSNTGHALSIICLAVTSAADNHSNCTR